MVWIPTGDGSPEESGRGYWADQPGQNEPKEKQLLRYGPQGDASATGYFAASASNPNEYQLYKLNSPQGAGDNGPAEAKYEAAGSPVSLDEAKRMLPGYSEWTSEYGVNEGTNTDGGFGDLLPIIALTALAIATGPAGAGLWGSAAGAGTTAGAGLIGTGMNAGALSIAGQTVGYGTTLSGTAGALAGGTLLSSIGTNAAIGAGKSLVTGGDPLEGALIGAVGGAAGSAIAGTGASWGLEGVAATAVDKGLTAAVTGATGAAVNGGSFGDVLEAGAISGLTSGAGNYVAGTVLPEANNTVAGAAGGAAAGLTNAILTGGDVGNAVLTGAGAGAAGGLATDLGAGPGTAGAVGALAGGLIGSAVQQDPVITQPTATTPATAAPAGNFGLSFSDVLPEFIHNPRADMQWGTRLSGA